MSAELPTRGPSGSGRRVDLRNRRGRGMRGPAVLPSDFAPDGVPLNQTRRERFDDLVLGIFDDIELRWTDRLPPVDLAVEEVPALPADWADRQPPLATTIPAGPNTRPRLVVFRRPIERRAATQEDLAALVLAVLVEQVAPMLGVAPDDVHPDYRDEA